MISRVVGAPHLGRSRRSIGASALGVLLAIGCGPGAGDPVAVTLDPAGLTVQVETQDHAVLTLDVPAGAVAEAMDVLIMPVEPQEGEAARFVVSPSGVSFAQPVTATVDLRRPFDGDAPLGFAWEDQGIRTPVLSDGDDRHVEGSWFDLGFPAEVAEGPLQLTTDPSSAFVVEPFGCQGLGAANDVLVNAVKARSPAEVRRAWTAWRAVVDTCKNAREAAAIARIEQAACDRYDAALLVAQATAAEDFAGFLSVAGPLVEAVGEVQIASGTCDVSGYTAVLNDKMTQALTFFEARLSTASLSSDLEPELDMLDTLIAFDTTCQQLDIDVCGPLRDVLYPRVLDILRQGAWGTCQATGRPTLSGVLYEDRIQGSRPVAGRLPPRGREDRYFGGYANFTYGDLEEDVTYCASRLEITVFDGDTPPSEVTPAPAPLAPGALPGSGENEMTLDIEPDWSLTLGGRVTTLVCAPGITTDDALVARVKGTEVGRAVAGPGVFSLGTQPLVVTVPTLVAAAGADAKTFDLELIREGTACGTYSAPYTEFVLHLKLPEEAPEDTDPPATVGYVLLGAVQGSSAANFFHVSHTQPRDFLETYTDAISDTYSDALFNTGATGTAHASIASVSERAPTNPGAPTRIAIRSITTSAAAHADLTVPRPDPLQPQRVDAHIAVHWEIEVRGAPVRFAITARDNDALREGPNDRSGECYYYLSQNLFGGGVEYANSNGASAPLAEVTGTLPLGNASLGIQCLAYAGEDADLSSDDVSADVTLTFLP
jgi:hypothetical protein